ncbi:MAG: hypothetical protein QM831_42065 [Kofleriaceae bacterium]
MKWLVVIAVIGRVAGADDRVLLAPTAELPDAGAVTASAELDRHGTVGVRATLGFGGLAQLAVEGVDQDSTGHLVTTFRMGVPKVPVIAGLVKGETTTAYLVASESVGPARFHAGGEAIATTDKTIFRPLGGIEVVPPTFPKTTLLVDISWEPQLAFSWGVRYRALAWAALELAVRHDEATFGDPDVFVRVTGYWDTVLSR